MAKKEERKDSEHIVSLNYHPAEAIAFLDLLTDRMKATSAEEEHYIMEVIADIRTMCELVAGALEARPAPVRTDLN